MGLRGFGVVASHVRLAVLMIESMTYSHLHTKLQSMFARRACLLLFATPSASACRPVRHILTSTIGSYSSPYAVGSSGMMYVKAC